MGASCNLGHLYAQAEFSAPSRVFTGSVRVIGGNRPVASMKSASLVPRDNMMVIARKVASMRVNAPVEPGQVLARLEDGTELVATTTVSRLSTEDMVHHATRQGD